MTKHLMDHPRTTRAGRVLHYLRIARANRSTWHRSESKLGSTRVVQFCRIARGRMV
jgi:hypothetical protein